MATHDYVLDNATGANFRSDLNNALAAIVSNNSASSEPSTKYAYQWWADTSANILKLRNSSNDGWINLFSLSGGLDVDAASNFNEDVTFTGASANVVFDKSDNAFEFADNAKAKFGTGGDLEIYHDASDSYIVDSGTGSLIIGIAGTSLSGFYKGTGSEKIAIFIPDGGVELYHNNVKMIETTSAGTSIPDGKFAKFGDGDDLTMGHNTFNYITYTGADFLITGDSTNNVKIQPKSDEQAAVFKPNAEVGLYYDAVLKFETKSTGGQIHGQLQFGDGASSAGSNMASFGASDDLKIFHDGSNSKIVNTTGHIVISSNSVDINNAADNETLAKFDHDGGVELYFDNSKKLEVLTGGVNIVGSLTVNGAAVGGGSSDSITEGNSTFEVLDTGTNGIARFLGEGSEVFRITHEGKVGINTTSPERQLHIIGNDGAVSGGAPGNSDTAFIIENSGTNGSIIEMISDNNAYGNIFFTDPDASNQGQIVYYHSTDLMTIQSAASIHIKPAGGENGIVVGANGTVSLYFDNALKFQTASNKTFHYVDCNPANNGNMDLGASSERWRDIYSTNSLNTSDRTLKENILTCDLGLDFINKLKPVSYKWIQKPDENLDTKTHYGLIAQDVENAIKESGKTLDDFGGINKQKEGAMHLAYTEIISPLVKAVQELAAKVAALEAA